MSKKSLSLGKLFGIPIGVDLSWFLILILLSWSFAVGYYPNAYRNWPVAQYWILGIITAIALFGSVLLHELGHSLVALMYGIPVKSITLFIFGGISQISEEPKNALSEFWITLAGPIVSLALAGIFAVLTLITTGFVPLLALVQYLAYINILLFLFNLIPGFPLDGGGVLMAIIWGITHNRHRAIIIAANVGRVVAYLLILIGVYQIFTSSLFNGLWTAFIGWFLLDAAGGQVQQEKAKGLLSGHQVQEAMNQVYTTVQADTTLQYLIDNHIIGGSRRVFLVEDHREIVGLLTLHQLSDLPKEKWSATTAAEVMLPLEKTKQISPTTELWEAMERMDRNGVNQMPVMSDGHVAGMLAREDVISFLRRLQPNHQG